MFVNPSSSKKPHLKRLEQGRRHRASRLPAAAPFETPTCDVFFVVGNGGLSFSLSHRGIDNNRKHKQAKKIRA